MRYRTFFVRLKIKYPGGEAFAESTHGRCIMNSDAVHLAVEAAQTDYTVLDWGVVECRAIRSAQNTGQR